MSSSAPPSAPARSSVFRAKGAQVATVAYIAAAVLALLAIAGFVHGFKTSQYEAFAAPERPKRKPRAKGVVGV